jgi:hypothetical protein
MPNSNVTRTLHDQGRLHRDSSAVAATKKTPPLRCHRPISPPCLDQSLDASRQASGPGMTAGSTAAAPSARPRSTTNQRTPQ